ncbi:hypothetical protein DBV15_08080 [Temnothorax longispinosus]|uniref:Uncharacterized protein n=1 Tax=Temnothorax longispinosus TaxID=300112 RepID=A0A4S2JNC8_9HYME|nr:hypothetical protein DBV15_08080 [Temnothorax longispinosus]
MTKKSTRKKYIETTTKSRTVRNNGRLRRPRFPISRGTRFLAFVVIGNHPLLARVRGRSSDSSSINTRGVRCPRPARKQFIKTQKRVFKNGGSVEGNTKKGGDTGTSRRHQKTFVLFKWQRVEEVEEETRNTSGRLKEIVGRM